MKHKTLCRPLDLSPTTQNDKLTSVHGEADEGANVGVGTEVPSGEGVPGEGVPGAEEGPGDKGVPVGRVK